jgi:hypothetical protein
VIKELLVYLCTPLPVCNPGPFLGMYYLIFHVQVLNKLEAFIFLCFVPQMPSSDSQALSTSKTFEFQAKVFKFQALAPGVPLVPFLVIYEILQVTTLLGSAVGNEPLVLPMFAKHGNKDSSSHFFAIQMF